MQICKLRFSHSVYDMGFFSITNTPSHPHLEEIMFFIVSKLVNAWDFDGNLFNKSYLPILFLLFVTLRCTRII